MLIRVCILQFHSDPVQSTVLAAFSALVGIIPFPLERQCCFWTSYLIWVLFTRKSRNWGDICIFTYLLSLKQVMSVGEVSLLEDSSVCMCVCIELKSTWLKYIGQLSPSDDSWWEYVFQHYYNLIFLQEKLEIGFGDKNLWIYKCW